MGEDNGAAVRRVTRKMRREPARLELDGGMTLLLRSATTDEIQDAMSAAREGVGAEDAAEDSGVGMLLLRWGIVGWSGVADRETGQEVAFTTERHAQMGDIAPGWIVGALYVDEIARVTGAIMGRATDAEGKR